MKHFLLLLTLLCSLAGYGQSTKKATFNFSSPSSLSPSYHDKDFTTDAGPAVKVSNVTFKSGDVSLSFTETGSCPGVWLSKRPLMETRIVPWLALAVIGIRGASSILLLLKNIVASGTPMAELTHR